MNTIKEKGIDTITITIYSIIVLFGWLSIYSSSYNDIETSIISLNTIPGKQILFIISSIVTSLFILLIDPKIIYRLSYLVYFMSIASLILVLFVGKEVGGAKAWFNFGQFGLQPSEFAKIGTILAVAKFINDRNIYLEKFRFLLKILLFIAIPILLILLQPDAGSALIYGSFVLMFYREGLPTGYVISIILGFILMLFTIIFGANLSILFLIMVTLGLTYLLKKNKHRLMISLIFFILFTTLISSVNYGYEKILEPHQKERIDLILGKEKNKLGSGYNLNQSLIAIGSGRFLGKGYLQGTQTKGNFIPEQNTDFIFCTIGEEFGFLGSVVVLILFAFLITRIIILSEKQTSRFSRIIGYSLGSILFMHTLINTGMTIGLIPVIGIPLPFFSYGGSSMLAFSILLFIFIKLDTCRLERF